MKLAMLALIASFFLCFVAVRISIPLFKKLKAGQPILKYVKEHVAKSGTPTMGGLCFIVPSLLVSIFFLRGSGRIFALTVAICLAYLVVGFLDDFIKIKSKNNAGLKPYQKILFQIAIASIGAVFCYYNGLDFLHLPYLKKTIFIGKWIIPLVAVIFLAVTNSVNLTDGLDGLAGFVSFVYLMAIGLILAMQMQSENLVNGYELKNLTTLSFSVAGGVLAFLCFNFHKASLFMGDTGSMALGGIIASLSVFSGNSLYIPLLGIMYVVSSISVIVQVAWFKVKNRRIFLMAPFHHHLQQKGYSEGKIAFSYATITFLVAISLIASLL